MSNEKLSGDVWVNHDEPMEPLYGGSDQIERRVWFQSKPLTREFCQRVVQLQLCTDSHDQGYADDLSQGAWSWFDIAIFADENSNEPKRANDGQEMAWKSHSNQLAHLERTMHYGYMFDRRSELLANIEVGNVLAVRACVRFPGWANYGTSAFLTTRTINEDLFPTNMWTLTSKSPTKHDNKVMDCMYTYSATSGCYVKASDASLKSKIWFTTPAFNQDMIDKLESIQLLARSRLHFKTEDGSRVVAAMKDSYSWFDIVVLDSPTSNVPKVINGLSMVWLSHNITDQDFGRDATAGQLFDDAPLKPPAPRMAEVEVMAEDNDMTFEPAPYEGMPAPNVIESQDSPLLEQWRERAAEIQAIRKSMAPGNAIGVRVCAQFEGGEIYAESGQLAVRISNEDRPTSKVELPDVSLEAKQSALIKKEIMKYQASLECPEGFSTKIEAPEVTMLDHEIRADQVIKVNGDVPPPYTESDQRPLRLLSLDGGGVRGVSELRMLDNIMNGLPKVQYKDDKEPRAPHPYEVFDMMAGTSTGGLIAIMLGRLKMTIGDCEKAYDEVAQAIFEHKDGNIITRNLNSAAAAFAAGSYQYASEPLINEVKKLVKKYLPGEGEEAQLLSKADDSGCKVFVVACRANATNDGQQVVQLRSYPTPQTMPSSYTYPEIKIWEAARATSAAPAYFERLRYGDEQFIDGGMVYNNPTPLVLTEVGEVFGYRRPIGCLLSLGTGVPVNLKFSDGVLPIADLIGMLTNSEKAHHLAGPLSKAHVSPGVLKYVRFNLSKALSDSAQFDKVAARKPQSYWEWVRGKNKKPKDYVEMIADMADWKGIKRIRELTDDWLAYETQAIDDCVQMLQQGLAKPPQ